MSETPALRLAGTYRRRVDASLALDDAPVVDGEVRCPWHGYRFDVVSEACAAHSELKLAPAPAIRVEAGRIVAQRG